MSHKQQRDFIRSVRAKFPEFFKQQDKKILDVGALDINGSCRRFFSSQFYIGCDVGKGNGVDIITPAHRLPFVDGFFDCVVSCEAFEHDQYLPSTLINIFRMLKSGGLFVFTCATTGRKEHGTAKNNSSSSPHTNDYYRNVTESMVRSYLDFDVEFAEYKFDVLGNDLRFYGVRK